MIAPVKHDWPKIIAEIKAGYKAREGKELTDYKLALIVGADNTSIYRLKKVKGAQPLHHLGQCILALHSEYSKEISTDLSTMCHVKP